MAWRYSDETYILQKMNVLFFVFLFCFKKKSNSYPNLQMKW